MQIASVATNIFGIFVFLFLLWKKLKDDFSSEIIFKLGFGILIGIVIGFAISLRFFRGYFFWTSFMGGVLGLLATVFKFRAKFYEIFEAFIVSVLPWLGLIFLNDSVLHSSLSSFLGFIGILILIFISYYLGTHYKNYNWYKSGKIGFEGISTLGLVFFSRFVLAIFSISVLSLVGKYEAVLSGLGVLVCILLLLDLARKKE